MGKRKGFTLVEVTLFLAITALLFLGIAMGVQNSVFQQRYNDSTQSFLEFMRSVYSKVSNPQTTGSGSSDEAIYGKLVVFGEDTDLNGNPIDTSDEFRSIFVYDVVGKADTVSGALGSGDVKTMLKNLNVNVVRVLSRNADGDPTSVELASPEKYVPHWGAAIEDTSPGFMFTGSVLVVRHPRSGTINTLYSTDVMQINSNYAVRGDLALLEYIMRKSWINIDRFFEREIDFCVNPDGLNVNTGIQRQNIRIAPNARNASDVELIDLDSGENHCN